MTITCQPMDATSGAPAYSAQNERQGMAALFGGGSGLALGARSGFRVGTPSNILTASSTTWTLGPCSAVITPGAATAQGSYRWSTDSNVTGAMTAADATYTHKDIVYIQVNDSSSGDGSGALNATPQYLAGAPTASPVAPTLPARSFLVGTITVPPAGGGSPSVVLNPAVFVAAGGIQPVKDQTERDAMTAYDGLTVRRMDLPDRPLNWHDGTAWNDDKRIVGYLSTPALASGFSSGSWLFDELNNIPVKIGHKYEITYRFDATFTTEANDAFAVNLLSSLTTDTGTTGTSFEGQTLWSAPVANSGKTFIVRGIYTATATTNRRLLVTSGRLTGSSLYNIISRMLTVTDMGYMP